MLRQQDPDEHEVTIQVLDKDDLTADGRLGEGVVDLRTQEPCGLSAVTTMNKGKPVGKVTVSFHAA